VPGLIGRNPKEAFDKFRDHVAGVLNRTVTDTRLALIHLRDSPSAEITFRSGTEAIAAPLFGNDLFLWAGQELRVDPLQDGSWKLRTVRYTYRIQGPDESNCLRWEYVSREIRDDLFCRHHLQAPFSYQLGGKLLSFQNAHIPTGWVTIEEIIRCLIVDLGVRAKANNWDQILRESEEKFREWTARSI
jgi:hypothetical protein